MKVLNFDIRGRAFHWLTRNRSISIPFDLLEDFAFSPDFQHVAMIAEDGILRIMDLATEKWVSWFIHLALIWAFPWSRLSLFYPLQTPGNFRLFLWPFDLSSLVSWWSISSREFSLYLARGSLPPSASQIKFSSFSLIPSFCLSDWWTRWSGDSLCSTGRTSRSEMSRSFFFCHWSCFRSLEVGR